MRKGRFKPDEWSQVQHSIFRHACAMIMMMAGKDNQNSALLPVGHGSSNVGEQDRLAMVVATMREISLQDDPQAMVSLFRRRARQFFGGTESLSMSRRGLSRPDYYITRSTRWKEAINPWTQKDRLPLLRGGLLAELIYGNEPGILRKIHVAPDDPSYEYLQDARSLMCLPLYDEGIAANMVIRMSADPTGFNHVSLADAVFEANLFGRATSSLLMTQRWRSAYAELDLEMKRVADIQHSLLPAALPRIHGVDIAASYKTADRAGGDYYDFFDLGHGRWGVLIADVSGHGTPAAVVMAILRTILHGLCIECVTPAELLSTANRQLCNQSDRYDGTFVTAFYGVYDTRDRSLHYACAGHNPPLLVDRFIQVRELNQAQGLPLAVEPEGTYVEGRESLQPGDTLLLYTDGITEAINKDGAFYGRTRLLDCVHENVPNAQHIIDCIVYKLLGFTGNRRQLDDQTLVALRIQ